MRRIGRHATWIAAGLAAGLWAPCAQAAIVTYQGPSGLTAFNAAAGNPGIAIDFDSLSGNIAGSTIDGVLFYSPEGNTLEVVPAASTFTTAGFTGVIDASTNRLSATSGHNVLSPGGSALVPGPDLAQQDSLLVYFPTDMSAFGLDVLFQSYDLSPGVYIHIFDSSLHDIGTAILDGNGAPGGAPGGSLFFGVTSTAGNIRGLMITDLDNNNIFPDANLGYDTFRFGPSTPGVPEPASWAMMVAGFAGLGCALRRRRAQPAAARS